MKRTLLLSALGISCLGAAPLFIAPPSAQAQTHTDAAPSNVATVQSGSYVVEPSHTQISFSVLHFGFTYYKGIFSDVSGKMKLDARTPSNSKLSVVIPVSEVRTTSKKLDDELKGDDWLDASRFPNATFVSSKVEQTGPADAKVSGILTLHGVSHPETLLVHFIGAGINPLDKKYTVGFEGKITIKRSAYGVTKYVPYVSDDVKLVIAGAFEKNS